jgi:hypothetical protein
MTDIYINRIIQEDQEKMKHEKREFFFLWTVFIEMKNPTFLFHCRS